MKVGRSQLVAEYQSKVGSLELRFHCRADRSNRHVTSIGLIIIAMMLLFDPFLQQVVVYPDRLVASDRGATIVRAQRYQASSYEDLPLPSVVDVSMKVILEARGC